jgi:hypothetical protein
MISLKRLEPWLHAGNAAGNIAIPAVDNLTRTICYNRFAQSMPTDVFRELAQSVVVE